MSGDNTFVVVANRLPVDISVTASGNRVFSPSPGGLVSALSPVLEKQQGCWVGWSGTTQEVPDPFYTDEGILLYPVGLSEHDFQNFYEGFSNATLWPLYHDLIVPPIYHRHWWASYRDVNLKFAHAVADVAAHGATVWVQDYQLQLVPGILRQIRPDLTIGFFLHIPFPPADLFRQLPWREEIIRGLLGADLIGFHLPSNAANFLALTKQVAGGVGSHTGQPDELEVTGQPSVREITAHITTSDNRTVGVGAFPISIDVEALLSTNVSQEDKTSLRAELGNPETLILGVDRLDYTKGILQRLLAFEELLEAEALDPEKTLFVQVATPSRERIEHYKKTRSEVEEAVGRINGRFGSITKQVVHYYHQSLPKKHLVKLYSTADIMLVTPFKDGMNLVAKEYVACHSDGSGALVLSEFAGAAQEFSEAFLCNPFDMESVKRQLVNAVHALKHNPSNAVERMKALNKQVREHDVNLWATSFLDLLTPAHTRSS
ncbi:trehalose-6-phosphate synthase [Corynebacterium sp. sy017]|uniref:alpha,alpha-trehalose-phosphate synthase (UDP-forming) n=1 Tax=unclassified Corynebacterium TaxID=2624378 RepID=UPI0011867F54|nr:MULTISPECIES: trehalose-6-phosphate synthase [unclassified Corynebacterium]MBP3088593.1 trehalose-6-phosphate synthase [Corynebacterium sp. sy017]QDZ42002.1 trehalose-6-phosphate synthase [Corynebacterium sp. sy039]TSD91887.1 trehalose-6-phosphate synthase [Corynebacterium sp. SY003]